MREMIGHYKIIGELGRGGMGAVYKAHEMSLNRTVAIKVLAESLTRDPTYVARFVREAQSAAALNHPNAVSIYFIGEDKGLHYYAMEYVNGESVKDLLEREGALQPSRALALIRQALTGLEAAHKLGLVHRDIKPANIMITKDGVVKLADFGLAVRPETDTKLTETGMFVGTPGYLAPEQCIGEDADARTDIYSMGITLYEMLTARPAFDGDSVLAILHKVTQTEPADPRSLNPHIDSGTYQLLQKMIAKQPESRFQDCESLNVAIDQLTQGGKTVAVPPPVPPPAVNMFAETEVMAPASVSQRRSKGISAGAVLAVCLACVVVIATAGVAYWKWGQPDQTNQSVSAVQTDATVQDTSKDIETLQTQHDPTMVEDQPEETSSELITATLEDEESDSDTTLLSASSADTEAATMGGDPAKAELESEASPVAQPQKMPAKTNEVPRTDTRAEPTPTAKAEMPEERTIFMVPAGDALLALPIRDALMKTLSQRTHVVDERLNPQLESLVNSHRDASDLLAGLEGSEVTGLIYITVDLLSERTLRFMNRNEPAWTSQVTIRYLDRFDDSRNTMLFSDRREYTRVSAERVANQIEQKIRRDLQRRFHGRSR